MAEPSTGAVGAAAAGLTFFGVATGLDPAILIAGFAGGAWAQTYQPPMPFWKRGGLSFMASILAGYLAPVASLFVSFGKASETLPPGALQLPIAVLVGLTAQRVLGPAIMRFAEKKSEDAIK